MFRPMTKKFVIYLIFLAVNILIFFYNITSKTQWALDVFISVAIVTVILLLSKRLKITPEGFFLINLAFLLHNFGSFGFYAKQIGQFGYDNLVHFFSSMAAAYVTFNFIGRKLHIRGKEKVEKTVIDEHKAILIILVIATVSMLGVVIELTEYAGFLYLGEGEGLFFVGAGDSNRGGDPIAGQYVDTMGDIVVNTLGSFIGVIMFYYLRYRKKYWIKYR
jgi:uncharacterized membrane protein YjdF